MVRLRGGRRLLPSLRLRSVYKTHSDRFKLIILFEYVLLLCTRDIKHHPRALDV